MKKIHSITLFILISISSFTQEIEDYKSHFEKLIVERSDFDFMKDSKHNKDSYFESWKKFPVNDNDFIKIYSLNTKVFSKIDSINAKNNWVIYKNKLIEICRSKHLDTLTLSKCLTIIENSNKKIAFVPIAAYLARKGEIPVWVIFCKWEFLYALSDTTNTEGKYITYDHIRQWAIETKEFKIIKFQTCE